MIIYNTLPWTMCHIGTFGHLATASLKTLSRKNPVGQKSNIREKEYSALNVHITPSEMNNLILATCYNDTYANQSLYTNLVNNFARFGVSVHVLST